MYNVVLGALFVFVSLVLSLAIAKLCFSTPDTYRDLAISVSTVLLWGGAYILTLAKIIIHLHKKN